ncbi:MAG: Flp pilus assembly protein CpaB [Hyphomonadaceae bacterium]|nr:Flp pilus assembly protein CpaB [Hyphomonadaceae bacterium]
MSPVRLIILLVAAGAAIASVFLIKSIQQPAPAVAAAAEPVKREVPTKQLLVARHAIPIGKFITADDLKWQEWPANGATGSFIEQKAEPEALEKMAGAVARFEMVEGEPITLSKATHPGDASSMAAMLNPNMIASAVEIAPETAAGGFIQPNDRVDVILTRQMPAGVSGPNTVSAYRADLILANVRILAIDGVYGPAPEEGREPLLIGTRATLELTQQDSTLLSAAKKAGDLSLTLRSITDLQSAKGATPTGRVYRDGVAQGPEGVRVYRYGRETVSSAPAG